MNFLGENMARTPAKLIVISGCSSGGKSTLLNELSKKGYLAVPEVGRLIVKDQLKKGGNILPWQNPKLFCELLIEESVAAYQKAKETTSDDKQLIFFDRSFLEGISYYQTLKINDSHKYDYLIQDLRFYPKIFMAPPWKEIFHQDDERQHSYEDAINEYERLLEFYPKYGYQIIELPKVTVNERLTFILSKTKSAP